MINRLLPILSFMAVACTSPQVERSDTVPTPVAGGEETVSGVVRVVGSAPVNVQVVLQPETGRGLRLTGPLTDELQRLAGVEVAVTEGWSR